MELPTWEMKLHIVGHEKDTTQFSFGIYYQPNEILFQRKINTLAKWCSNIKHIN